MSEGKICMRDEKLRELVGKEIIYKFNFMYLEIKRIKVGMVGFSIVCLIIPIPLSN